MAHHAIVAAIRAAHRAKRRVVLSVHLGARGEQLGAPFRLRGSHRHAERAVAHEREEHFVEEGERALASSLLPRERHRRVQERPERSVEHTRHGHAPQLEGRAEAHLGRASLCAVMIEPSHVGGEHSEGACVAALCGECSVNAHEQVDASVLRRLESDRKEFRLARLELAHVLDGCLQEESLLPVARDGVCQLERERAAILEKGSRSVQGLLALMGQLVCGGDAVPTHQVTEHQEEDVERHVQCGPLEARAADE